MSEHSVVDRQPEAVELDGTGGDTLLVAAPALGPDAAPSELVSPSAVVDRLDSRQPLDSEASADGGVALSDDDRTLDSETPLNEDADVCVLRDLYAAYCEADDAAGLTAALDSQTSLAAVVAPHELDCLLGSDNAVEESHLEKFDRIVQLRYDPADRSSGGAVDTAVDAAVEVLDGNPDVKDVRADLSGFAYSHTYRHESLATVERYGPTLTPGVATHLSTVRRQDNTTALAPDDVAVGRNHDGLARSLRSAGRDIAEAATASLGIGSAGAAATAIFGGTATVAAPALGFTALGLTGWALVRDNDSGDSVTITDLLQRGCVPPPTRAKIEAEAMLCPGTIEMLHELTKPRSLNRLQTVVDDAPELVSELRCALDATDDSLAGTLTRLDERTRKVGALYDDQIAAAAKSLDAVANELQSDEAALLGPLVDREEIDPDQIPWVEVVADGDRENGDEGDSRETEIRTATRMSVAAGEKERPEQIDELIQTATSRSLTVLRGGHGTGKTTATYRAGRALEERGYTVRVPGLDSVDPTTVEHGLQQDADEEPLALVISFKRALAGESLDGHLRAVQSWIDSGLVDTVLIECREEFYDEFRQELPESNAGLGVVELESFDADETAPITAVARWVRDTLARAGAVADSVDPDAERIPDTKRKEIVDLAAGNSEITKVAAKFAFASDYSLDEIHTHEELVRDDIDHLIEEAPDADAEAAELLFDYLGVAGILWTRDLWALSDFDGVSLKRLAGALSGYLGPDIRRTLDQCGPGPWDDSDNGPDVADVAWRLSPAIYGDVTFRAALTEPKTRWRDSAFEELYTRLRELSLEDSPVSFHRSVAANFATAHKAARHRQERDGSEIPERADGDIRNYEPVGPERVEAQAQQFVKWVDEDCGPGAFVGSLGQLSFGPVPVDPSVFDDTERLLAGADTEASQRDVGGAVVLHNILGSQLAANIENSSSRTALTDDADAFAATVAKRDEYDPAQFLLNVYSMAIRHLAELSSPAEASEWTEWVTQQADTVATDGSHDDDPAVFLENVYSMAIKHLADSSSPAEVSAWTEWVAQQADTVATDGSHDDDPGQFLENVYSMAISKLAESSSPAEASEWIDRVYEAIRRYASGDTHDRTRDEFVADCCAMALAKVTPKLPATESAWHADILTRSLKATPSTAVARFYARYANCLTQDDVDGRWLSWIITDCLNRTIHAEQPVTDDPEGLAASVVANTLFGPASNFDNGLAEIPELPDTVAKLATDRETFETVLDGVETRYDDGDVSELVLSDPESTDVKAVGQRVLAWVRGRAFVHAVTDDTDTAAEAIHDAAVETAREESEPEVPLARFYTVALVGLAAETDPENAGTHDDLLGEALRREAIKSPVFCLAYFRELSSADGYLPGPAPNFDTFEWHLHLVDDLLTRAETDAAGLPDDHEQTGEMIAVMLGGMADGTYPASGPTRKFHTLLDTVADHDTDAAVTAHAIERVLELLDEEYANLLAKFDWEERFA